MQTNTKLTTLTKPIGTSLELDNRSHEKKKATLTKTKPPILLKLLAALCMLDCVGAAPFMMPSAVSGRSLGRKGGGCTMCNTPDEEGIVRLVCCTCLKNDYKCPRKGSCMSGNTGTFKVSTVDSSKAGAVNRTVAIITELTVGDMIEGLDADKQPALCTVEAIGQFGHGALYGNYTEDHFMLDPATGNIMQHGAVGNRTVEDKYDMMTSCPVALDEAGSGFTPMDGDFCGKNTSKMGWSDYLLIHASMLRIVRATGAYWFSASAYRDFASVAQHGPELCAAMLACAGAGAECNELERISALFINSDYLTDDARNATMKGMPGLGEVGTPGSVSFVVSQGKARSTEHRVLIAAGAVAGAAMISLLLVVTVVAHSVVRRKRSSPTPTTVELTPGTLKLDQAAAPEIATA